MSIAVECPFCQKNINNPPFISKRTKETVEHASQFDCSSMGHHHHNDIYRCGRCDLGFLWPLPVNTELEDSYANVVDDTYLNEKEARYRTFAHALKVMSGFKDEGDMLEIGSYAGYFMDLAQQQGFKVTGVEPSHWASDFAQQEFGHEVIQGAFGPEMASTELAGRKYDAIVAWDVLEHVHDPVSFLKTVDGLLKPNGIFAFSTLNVDSWFPKVLGKRWPWYMQMHLYYFTLQSLSSLLWQNGMSMIHQEPYHHIISANYFVKKIETLLGIPLPVPSAFKKSFDTIFIPFHFGDIVLVVARKR